VSEVSVSLKLLHNSNKNVLQISIKCNTCGWGFSDTITPISIPIC